MITLNISYTYDCLLMCRHKVGEAGSLLHCFWRVKQIYRWYSVGDLLRQTCANLLEAVFLLGKMFRVQKEHFFDVAVVANANLASNVVERKAFDDVLENVCLLAERQANSE